MKFGKVWGNTRPIFELNNVEIHRIEVNKGGYCSTHKHNHKWNFFWVESGELAIEVIKNDYNLTDRTVLKPMDSMVVAPGEFHKFEALEDTVAYEVYYVLLDANDIERKDHGGTDYNSNTT